MLRPQSGYCVMPYNDSSSSADLNICITLCHWLLHLHLPLVNEADCGHRCRRARTASCLVPLYTKPHPHHTACFKHSDQSKQSLWGVCMHPLTLIPAYTGIVQDNLADGRSRVLDGGMPGGFVFGWPHRDVRRRPRGTGRLGPRHCHTKKKKNKVPCNTEA